MLRYQKQGGSVHTIKDEIASLLNADSGDDLGFSEDMERCKGLHKQGLLDDQEFAEARRMLMKKWKKK